MDAVWGKAAAKQKTPAAMVRMVMKRESLSCLIHITPEHAGTSIDNEGRTTFSEAAR